TPDGQKQLGKEVTEIVTRISGDPNQASRTWVILTEAAEEVGGSQEQPTAVRNSPHSPPKRQQPVRNSPTIVTKCLDPIEVRIDRILVSAENLVGEESYL